MTAPNAASLPYADPAPTRRRVWTYPDLLSHSLLVLTPDRLFLAPLSGRPKPETVAAVEAGGDLGDHLGPLATEVDLATVRRARLDLLSNSLALDYSAGGTGTSRLTVVFAAPEPADACFTRVWRRLGEEAELVPYRRDPWALARAPLALLGAVLAATAILVGLLGLAEDLTPARAVATLNVPAAGPPEDAVRMPKGLLETLAGWLDWRVVCGTGGAAGAAAQVWLVRRLSRPPESLEVTRTSAPAFEPGAAAAGAR